jgi:hypothetical protein
VFSGTIRREVLILLTVKALALTLIYFVFFSAKPVVTPAAMQQQLSRAGAL